MILERMFSTISFIMGIYGVVVGFIYDSLGMIVSGTLFLVAMVYFKNIITIYKIDYLERKLTYIMTKQSKLNKELKRKK